MKEYEAKACVVCGKKYFPTGTKQRYCSPECMGRASERRMEEARRRRQEARPAYNSPGYKPRNCAVCGKEFKPASGRQRYCSPECMGRGFKQKEKERLQEMKDLKARMQALWEDQ